MLYVLSGTACSSLSYTHASTSTQAHISTSTQVHKHLHTYTQAPPHRHTSTSTQAHISTFTQAPPRDITIVCCLYDGPLDVFCCYRQLIKAIIILMPLMGVTWIIGLFAVSAHPATYIFSIAFIVLNTLQVC